MNDPQAGGRGRASERLGLGVLGPWRKQESHRSPVSSKSLLKSKGGAGGQRLKVPDADAGGTETTRKKFTAEMEVPQKTGAQEHGVGGSCLLLQIGSYEGLGILRGA